MNGGILGTTVKLEHTLRSRCWQKRPERGLGGTTTWLRGAGLGALKSLLVMIQLPISVKVHRETLYFRELIVTVNVEYLVHIYVECTVTDGLAQRNGLSRRPRKGTTPLINTRCSNLVPVIFRAKNRIAHIYAGHIAGRGHKTRAADNEKAGPRGAPAHFRFPATVSQTLAFPATVC